MKADILRVTANYNLKSTAYDRWNASQTIIDLSNEGMEFSPFGQGFGSMSAPTKQFEALVLTGENTLNIQVLFQFHIYCHVTEWIAVY